MSLASLVVQTVKNLPAMGETWVRSWVGKSPWRRTWQPTTVFLPGESPWTENPGRLQSTGSQRVGHDWATSRSCSVQFSHSVMSDSLQPYRLQHARPPCPSPTPGAYSNPCPLSWWCHPTISSSVVSFSFHLQSFPASRSFQMSQFFTSDGQSIGVSASASVL